MIISLLPEIKNIIDKNIVKSIFLSIINMKKEGILMFTPTRLKVYVNAYIVRLENGESLSNIDNYYLNRNKITESDKEAIHNRLKELYIIH